jgi:aminopeptidase N
MGEGKARPVHRKDYRPPAYLVERVDLHFDLDPECTRVRSKLHIRRGPDESSAPLVLDGRDLSLLSIALNGRPLSEHEYSSDYRSLTIPKVPAEFVLEVETSITPSANTALEGLYQSGSILCTQCEASGFSRITYFIDRPDVMARYRVTLRAERGRFPVLLANGNPVASGGEGGRHWVTWEDPFPKPCYLFALVAGDLACVEDGFTTMSGRDVKLRIYVEPENTSRCAHAMASLKQAMRWDEEAYGREYDLDIFMIVAVGSFNMGAMENKGLNIFNAKYILVTPETATDQDFEAVRDVIAHEYFHNWTGNRVTCRDWFQLCVKESLTVFREQQFSAAVGSAAIARIDQAKLMRTQQFAEDAGPTAHPVRPDSYVEVNNLYTLTVYEKGAEVIRMLHELLGAAGFRRGMDLYFERHDGQAVTVDQFVDAMAAANAISLERFRAWYSQAGTPIVEVSDSLDGGCYVLNLRQHTPPTAGLANKATLHIPIRVGLIGEKGGALTFKREGGPAPVTETILQLSQDSSQFRFELDDARPTPSLLRGFSAPVRLVYAYSSEQLQRLMAHDSDPLNRWDAAQRLYLNAINSPSGSEPRKVLGEALRQIFGSPPEDLALFAELIRLPSEVFVAEERAETDVEALAAERDGLQRELAAQLEEPLLAAYRSCWKRGPYEFSPASAARRRLLNACLQWLAALDTQETRALCLQQFEASDNMTEVMGALAALNLHDSTERRSAFGSFYRKWEKDPLILDKWLMLEATTPRTSCLERLQSIVRLPVFDIRNPNRVRALLGSFAQNNLRAFHRRDGAGHAFIAEQVIALDRLNPQAAARLVAPFTRWRRFASPTRESLRAQLLRVRSVTGLSRDVQEIAEKGLLEP